MALETLQNPNNTVKPATEISSLSASFEDLELLKPLHGIQLFIIQPRVDDYGIGMTDFFHPSVTHEVFTDKRNLLFRGASKRKFFKGSSGGDGHGTKKISLSNLRKRKILTVEFETSNLSNEAIVSCPPGSAKCRVIKYGGMYEHPSYTMSCPNSMDSILFSVDNSPSNSLSHVNNSSSSLDYNIFKGSSKKLVGRISSKSGLNFMLNIAEDCSLMEKSILLGLIIAMDVLKQGKATKTNNDYEYN